jgi:translation initiation factor IF-2
MGIVRINELAKRLGVTNKDIITELDKLGISGKTHSSGVSDDIVTKMEGVFKPIKPEPRLIVKVQTGKIETKPSFARPSHPSKIPNIPDSSNNKSTFTPVSRSSENTSINQPRPGNAIKKVILPTKVDPTRQRPPIDRKSHFSGRQDTRPKEFKPSTPQSKDSKPSYPQSKDSKPSYPQSKDSKPGFPQSKVSKPEESRFKRTKHEQPKGLAGLPQKNQQRRSQPKKQQSKRTSPNDNLVNLDKIITDLSPLVGYDANSKASMQRAIDSIRKVDYKKPQYKGIGKKGQRQRINFRNEPISQPLTSTAPRRKNIKLAEGISVREFAEAIGQKLPDVIKKFMEYGFTPTINQPIDIEASILVADAFGIKIEFAPVEDIEMAVFEEDGSLLLPRAPVVTIMGHVDHGKTSLLDTIRKTKVTESEAGGITQHIGAYKINLKGKDIVFLDTPGHEAFTMMRARGAKVTDIVVLVVAADDGVMPQTEEAINHANAANVPIIVAINKIDKENADVERVRNELAEKNVISEAWGGKNIFVEVSAKKKIGIDLLLEMILLQAEIIELKANPNKPATGVIIESRLDKGKGPVATVLVQAGTLRVGDIFVAGNDFGRVRALLDDMEHKIKEATPSTPVEVIGFTSVPNAGDIFTSVPDEKRARQITIARKLKDFKGITSHSKKLNLDDLYAMIKEGEIKELNIIIKADVQGSAEAIKSSVEAIKHEKVKVKVIHTSVGGINESDIMLASASNAIIVGFNVRAVPQAASIAEKEGVEIKFYNVIYDVLNDIKKGLEGLLEPTFKEKILGLAEVRQNFFISRLGTIAGCHVTSGVIQRASDGARVIRDSIVIFDGKIDTLKRFKDDVKEVHSGYECGLLIANFNDIKVGDIIENYSIEKIAGKL